MPWLTQLATVARRTGYPVVEVDGWQSRGREPQAAVDGIVCHHTATPASVSGDYPTLNVVKNGHSTLPGPLSHFGLGRSGTIYVIAAGRCNHNFPSTSPTHTNSRSIGIEAENSGQSSDPWPDVQVRAYAALVAELCQEFGLAVASAVRGHKEVNTSKNDPTFSMSDFRKDVADYLENGPQEDDVPQYMNIAHTQHTTIQPGSYVSLRWSTVWEDTAKAAHKGGLAAMTKPGDINGALWLDLEGLGTGEDVQVRMVDWNRTTKKYSKHPMAEGVGTSGKEFPCFPIVNRVRDGHTMDLRVHNVGPTPITLRRATLKAHVWPR